MDPSWPPIHSKLLLNVSEKVWAPILRVACLSLIVVGVSAKIAWVVGCVAALFGG